MDYSGLARKNMRIVGQALLKGWHKTMAAITKWTAMMPLSHRVGIVSVRRQPPMN
jgi:hypothetical protein